MKPEEKKKLLNKIFWKIFLSFLVAFTALYISEATGYYEYEQYRDVALTKEKIKQFETDVQNGKDIKVEDYIVEEDTDYKTGISNLGLSISNGLGETFQNGLEKTFDFLNKLMED